MTSSDSFRTARREPTYGASLDALRTPLATILGTSQFLQRRIVRGGRLSPDGYLAALARIERAAWEMEGRLRVHQGGDGTTPNNGD